MLCRLLGAAKRCDLQTTVRGQRWRFWNITVIESLIGMASSQINRVKRSQRYVLFSDVRRCQKYQCGWCQRDCNKCCHDNERKCGHRCLRTGRHGILGIGSGKHTESHARQRELAVLACYLCGELSWVFCAHLLSITIFVMLNGVGTKSSKKNHDGVWRELKIIKKKKKRKKALSYFKLLTVLIHFDQIRIMAFNWYGTLMIRWIHMNLHTYVSTILSLRNKNEEAWPGTIQPMLLPESCCVFAPCVLPKYHFWHFKPYTPRRGVARWDTPHVIPRVKLCMHTKF